MEKVRKKQEVNLMEEQMHFRVDGEWFTDFVRTLYHYENKQEQALKALNTIEGLTMKDAYAILGGDAHLASNPDGETVALIYEPEVTYQEELKEHLKFKEIQKEKDAKSEEEYKQACNDYFDKEVDRELELEKVQGYIEQLEQALRNLQKDATITKTDLECKKQAIEILKNKFEMGLLVMRQDHERAVDDLKDGNTELQKQIAHLTRFGVFPWTINQPTIIQDTDERFTQIEMVSVDEMIDYKKNLQKKSENSLKTDKPKRKQPNKRGLRHEN
jgi:hypothetical protein